MTITVGGAVANFVGQINPQDLLGQSLEFIENRNTSELAKLLKNKSLSEKGFMTGMVIQQISDIAQGYIATTQLSIRAHERVQTMAIQLAAKALKQEYNIQVKVTNLAVKHQEMLEKITSNSSAVAQMMDNVNKRHLEEIREAQKIENETRFERVMKALEDAFKCTTQSLNQVVQAQREMVKSGVIDPAFFTKCIEMNVELMREVTQMTRELAKQDEAQLKSLKDKVLDSVKSIQGVAANQSLEAPSAPKESIASNANNSEVKAITDLAEASNAAGNQASIS
jgi:hypothetical protein